MGSCRSVSEHCQDGNRRQHHENQASPHKRNLSLGASPGNMLTVSELEARMREEARQQDQRRKSIGHFLIRDRARFPMNIPVSAF